VRFSVASLYARHFPLQYSALSRWAVHKTALSRGFSLRRVGSFNIDRKDVSLLTRNVDDVVSGDARVLAPVCSAVGKRLAILIPLLML
jgi:hypothetical protein